jgi:hypothetical protein
MYVVYASLSGVLLLNFVNVLIVFNFRSVKYCNIKMGKWCGGYEFPFRDLIAIGVGDDNHDDDDGDDNNDDV